MFVRLRGWRPGRGLSSSPAQQGVAEPRPECPDIVDVRLGLPGAGRAGAVLGTVWPGGVVGRVPSSVSQSGLQGQSLLPGTGGVT